MDIQNAAQRVEIRRTFFENTVPVALKLLLTGSRDSKSQYTVLKRALERDWEFKFTVNYFLREDQYNSEPYESLLQVIETFFTDEIEERGES